MQSRDVLRYAFSQVEETLRGSLDGLTAEQLDTRVGPDANPIGWLAWHLLRVQDDHVADVAGSDQVWTAQGFARRFDLPVEASAIGYGMSSEEVAAVRIEDPALLVEYSTAVHARTAEFLAGLGDGDLDRVVDTRWDPPVTLGVRLVSVLGDDLQHLGQIGYVRGLLGS
ncbi:DinB family protein [Blastococcus sp. URHD0036]|uniref:mycothiol transferase n=1 Tax=Blastococcus sp. URHD0036 TaxID=1380356 RepID=UPI000495D0ED|nr:DinB family protein [Blastococcus sp. URHD0036]